MTFEEIKKICRIKLKEVSNGIRQVEAQTGAKILQMSGMSFDNNNETGEACFNGYNRIDLDIPYALFLSIPTKRLIIEISRALTVEYNKFEDRMN